MAIAVLEEAEIQKIISETVKLATAELRDELERSRTPELMTKEMLADYIHKSVSSITRWMSQLKDPLPFEPCGDGPLFRKCCVDSWLKKRSCSQCRFLSCTTESESPRDTQNIRVLDGGATKDLDRAA